MVVITRLSKLFIAVFSMLLLGVAAVFIDVSFSTEERSLEQSAALSRLPGMALSVHYFEARIRAYEDASATLYPDMRPINYMDFIYVP